MSLNFCSVDTGRPVPTLTTSPLTSPRPSARPWRPFELKENVQLSLPGVTSQA